MERFNVETKLGDGAFGTAHLVSRKSDGKKFVVKEIEIHSLTPNEKDFAMQEAMKMMNLRESD